VLFHGIKTNYTGDKIPLILPLKVAIKVIYSHGIKSILWWSLYGNLVLAEMRKM
jgi:hypothetical protein